MSEGTQRRLAAIVSADVVGYSRLMGVDETGTLAALRGHREELIDPLIAKHGGRIVKTMGDGLLLEFPSVVNATQCVVEVQQGMSERNANVDEDRRITFRVGVNLGDIIIEGEDILGDGVNIAARLQEIAEPGGIAVSARVHEDIRDRLDAAFLDAGDQELKNIARPVKVWTWSPERTAALSTGALAVEALQLLDKPSIAVLPFDNLSGDKEQEYFADGIAEDIISALSQLPWFFVISRNSSFSFKGQSKDVPQMARELGVQYILEGSIRKAGNRVRITAQLIDARNDRHIWADRFDREMDDIFAVQDEITEKIVGAVSPEFLAAEIQRAQRKETQDLDSWDLLMRARWHYSKFTKVSNEEAIELLEKLVALDPKNDLALGDLANCRLAGIPWYWYDDPAQSLAMARESAEKAIAINARNVPALLSLAIVEAFSRNFDEAVSQARQALAFAPNTTHAHGYLGACLTLAGECDEALEELNVAIRLGPRDPLNAMWHSFIVLALFHHRRYEECIKRCRDVLRDLPNPHPAMHRPMAASLAMLERMDEARDAIIELRKRAPNVTAEATRSFPFKDLDVVTRYADAMEKAEAEL
jgi:TolB-like protein/class 3 adenylate cyclase/tetratricopeptide (TPR) repeat protein